MPQNTPDAHTDFTQAVNTLDAALAHLGPLDFMIGSTCVARNLPALANNILVDKILLALLERKIALVDIRDGLQSGVLDNTAALARVMALKGNATTVKDMLEQLGRLPNSAAAPVAKP